MKKRILFVGPNVVLLLLLVGNAGCNPINSPVNNLPSTEAFSTAVLVLPTTAPTILPTTTPELPTPTLEIPAACKSAALSPNGPAGGPVVVNPGGPGSAPGGGPIGGSVMKNMIPAPELPTTAAAVTGLFIERQDNIVVVESMLLQPGASPSKIEVVITEKTTIYCDTTQPSPDAQTIQQTVEKAPLYGLGEHSLVTVWGQKMDDRIIADVLVYAASGIITK